MGPGLPDSTWARARSPRHWSGIDHLDIDRARSARHRFGPARLDTRLARHRLEPAWLDISLGPLDSTSARARLPRHRFGPARLDISPGSLGSISAQATRHWPGPG